MLFPAATYGDGALGYMITMKLLKITTLNPYGVSKMIDKWAVKQSYQPLHWVA